MKFQIFPLFQRHPRRGFDIDMKDTVAKAMHVAKSVSFAESNCEVAPSDALGVDLIRLEAGQSFPPHTHPGHHCLLVVQGRGSVTVDGKVHVTMPGDLYVVDGGVLHSVGAIDDHVVASFGVPHRMPDAEDRMTVSASQ